MTGWNGAGSIETPMVAAIISAAASACSHAIPPCLTGNRHVADGVDVLKADNSTMTVDRNKAVGVARNPGYPRAVQPRHCDDTVRLNRWLIAQLKVSFDEARPSPDVKSWIARSARSSRISSPASGPKCAKGELSAVTTVTSTSCVPRSLR